ISEAEGLLGGINGEQIAGYLRGEPNAYDTAGFLVRAGEWSQAEAFLARLTDAAPTNGIAWSLMLRATVLAELGDRSGYEKVRDRTLPGISGVTNASEVGWFEVVPLILLPMNSAQTILEGAIDRAIASEPDAETLHWLHLTKALVRYREGDFVRASQ